MSRRLRVKTVAGLIALWSPTVLLGCLWVRSFLFFISIEDHGLNDFATVFHGFIGFVLACVAIGVALLSLILNALLWTHVSSAETPRPEA